MVLGHSDPTLLDSLIVTIKSLSPEIGSPASPLRDTVVHTVSGSGVIPVCTKGKSLGACRASHRMGWINGGQAVTSITMSLSL